MKFKPTLFALVLSFFVIPLHAQEVVKLQIGDTIESELSSDGKDIYAIELGENSFVFGYADQLSVDVVVTIYGPDNSRIAEVDGPGVGPEYFQFDSDVAGAYRIEVTPFEEASGSYTMVMEMAEPVATDPDARVDQLMVLYNRESSPGVVVAVMQGEDIAFQKAYGMANMSHDIPFTTDTITNIGSTSKQFTAMGIMLLVADGKLSLDDDIRMHIPELPDLGSVVTIRNLLTHTSGYREFLNQLLMTGRILGEGDHIAREELIEIVQRQPELQNEPGAEWNYNNTAFGLLAVVIERISEQDFPEWMSENVFSPLEMNDTRVRAHVGEIIPNSAQGYVPATEGGIREATDISASMGAGGIYTTVGDLAKWMRNYHTAELGGQESIDAITTPFVLTSGDTTGYGLGLMIDEVRGLRRYNHGGADTAHRSTFVYFPDLEAGFTVQSNYGAFNGSIAGEIAELFFGDQMEPDDEMDEVAENSDFDPESYNPEDFDDFAGQYELDIAPGFILTFSREGDNFFTQATGQPQFPIFVTSDSTFMLQVVEASLTFHRESDGSVNSVTLHQGGDNLAHRIADDTAPVVLEDYVGRYFSEELETFYDLVLEDSSLVLQHRRIPDITLNHSKSDSFAGGQGIATVEFDRGDDGSVSGLRVGNGRTRNVRFTKVNH